MIVPAAVLLLVGLIGCAYPYFGYPLRLAWRARKRTLIVRSQDIEPTVSVIIPVYNGEQTIAAKLRNTLDFDYRETLLEIIVVSDGSTDRTAGIVESFDDPRVKLVTIPRSGRLVALQQGGRRARGEILAFTDPNVSVDTSALRYMVRHFADRFVGGVCAARKVRRPRDGDGTGVGEALFTHFEHWVRGLESRTGSVHAADTGFFAIRRALFVPPRNPAQADDVAISTRIVLGGYRLVYEPRAVCRREVPADGARDFRRRVYIVNYTVRALLDVKGQLLRNRAYGSQLMAHTVDRCLVPFYAVSGLVGTALFATVVPEFCYVLAAEQTLLLLALLGWRLRATRVGRWPFLALPCWFAVYHLAGLLGLMSVLRGSRPLGATPRAAAATANHTGA